jgi:uncharacterized protein (TIGR02118 family)
VPRHSRHDSASLAEDTTPVIKSISLLVRRPDLTHEQFVRHWVDVHAPLAHAVPGLRRYVQSHIVEERPRPDIPSLDGEIDGIAELWYDDRESMARAIATPQVRAAPRRRRAVHRADQDVHGRGARRHFRWQVTGRGFLLTVLTASYGAGTFGILDRESGAELHWRTPPGPRRLPRRRAFWPLPAASAPTAGWDLLCRERGGGWSGRGRSAERGRVRRARNTRHGGDPGRRARIDCQRMVSSGA